MSLPDLLSPEDLERLSHDLKAIKRIDAEIADLQRLLELGGDHKAIKNFGVCLQENVEYLEGQAFGQDRLVPICSMFSNERIALVALFALRNAMVHERAIISDRICGHVLVPDAPATLTSMAEIWQIFDRDHLPMHRHEHGSVYVSSDFLAAAAELGVSYE